VYIIWVCDYCKYLVEWFSKCIYFIVIEWIMFVRHSRWIKLLRIYHLTFNIFVIIHINQLIYDIQFCISQFRKSTFRPFIKTFPAYFLNSFYELVFCIQIFTLHFLPNEVFTESFWSYVEHLPIISTPGKYGNC